MRRLAALVFATAVAMAISAPRAIADEDFVLAGTVHDGSELISTQVRVYRMRSAFGDFLAAKLGPSAMGENPELWFSGALEMLDLALREREEVATTESDASGRFQVEGLTPALYQCEVQTQDGEVAMASPRQSDSGIHEVDLDLTRDAWPMVRGQILEHDGRPFKGHVLAWHSGMPPEVDGVAVPVAADGRFAIRVPKEVPVGETGLAAIEPGRRVIRWGLAPDRAAGVTYVGGGHGRLPVVVRAAGTRAPVAGARVLRATRLTLADEREREVFELAVTDATGHAWMGRPPPTGTTSYTVIQAPGFQRTVDAVEATEDRVEFTLASSVRVTGRLEGHVPADASAWVVTLWFWPSTWFMPIWRTAPLRQDGTFDVGDLPGAPNHAIVGVRGPGFVGVRCLDSRLDALVRLPAWMVPPIWQAPLEASEWPRCLEEEREPHRELVVPIEATARLQVAVHDAHGGSLTGARLWIQRGSTDSERPLATIAWKFSRPGLLDDRGRVTTNAEGVAHYDGLGVGETVTVCVERSDHQLVELAEVRIRSAGLHTLELTLPDAKD